MIQLWAIGLTLSINQKKDIIRAYQNKEDITIILTKDCLCGLDNLYVPFTVVKRYNKYYRKKKDMEIKISKSNIRRQPVHVYIDDVVKNI